jgi:hypothetical protein
MSHVSPSEVNRKKRQSGFITRQSDGGRRPRAFAKNARCAHHYWSCFWFWDKRRIFGRERLWAILYPLARGRLRVKTKRIYLRLLAISGAGQ